MWVARDFEKNSAQKRKVFSAYLLLSEFYRYLEREDLINKNPMRNVEMMKKANYLSAQGIENKPQNELVTVFSLGEIELLKAEALSASAMVSPCTSNLPSTSS